MSSHTDSRSAAHPVALRRLLELVDTKAGLPITSHRPAPVGKLLVAAKSTFRRVCQPFINELLRKQVMFNEQVIESVRSLLQEIHSVDSSSWMSRRALDQRLKAAEQELDRLRREMTQLSSAAARAAESTVAPHGRNGAKPQS